MNVILLKIVPLFKIIKPTVRCFKFFFIIFFIFKIGTTLDDPLYRIIRYIEVRCREGALYLEVSTDDCEYRYRFYCNYK